MMGLLAFGVVEWTVYVLRHGASDGIAGLVGG